MSTHLGPVCIKFHLMQTRLHQMTFDANAFASIFNIFKIHFFAVYALWIPEMSILISCEFGHLRGSKWGFGKIKKKKKIFFFCFKSVFLVI